MKVLLSIKPQFANAIFNGGKRFEYRKVIFKKKVSSIQVYVTKPIGKIIGEFEIDDIMQDSPLNIWKHTEKYSGVEREFFMQYFNNRKIGYAIKIKKIKKYKKPLSPYAIYPDFIAPQSFKYII